MQAKTENEARQTKCQLEFRLHPMHEMQIIDADVSVCLSVSLSVSHAASLGFGVQKRLNGLRSRLG